MSKRKKFKSPFKFCPKCGHGIKDFNGRDFCYKCGMSAYKIARGLERFYSLFKPEDFEDYDDQFGPIPY